MSNLWPRIEPLLAKVEKPARYIGMERGALAPEHRPGQAAFLLWQTGHKDFQPVKETSKVD